MKIIFSVYISLLVWSFYILIGIIHRRSLPAICEGYFALENKCNGKGYLYSIWISLIAMSYALYYIFTCSDIKLLVLMLLTCNGLSLMGGNPRINRPRSRFLHDLGLGMSCVFISIYVLVAGYQLLIIPAIVINCILCIIGGRYLMNSIGILLGYLSVMAYIWDFPSIYNILGN